MLLSYVACDDLVLKTQCPCEPFLKILRGLANNFSMLDVSERPAARCA